MDLTKHKDSLTNFVGKMFDEMAQEMGLAKPGATLGMSVDDSIVLDRLPSDRPETLSGFYRDLSGKLTVEIVSYSQSNGMVVVEIAVNLTGNVIELKSSMMDYHIFSLLFVKA